MFKEGTGSLREAIRLGISRNRQSMHPYHVFIDGSMKFYEKYPGELTDEVSQQVEEMIELAKSYYPLENTWDELRGRWRAMVSGISRR